MHPSLSRAFKKHQEHHLKHTGSVDLITTKQNKLPSFIDRYVIRRFWHISHHLQGDVIIKHHGLNQHRRDDLILQLHSGPCSRNWMISFDVIPFLSNVVMSSLMHTLWVSHTNWVAPLPPQLSHANWRTLL
jgi:hypothetical protein